MSLFRQKPRGTQQPRLLFLSQLHPKPQENDTSTWSESILVLDWFWFSMILKRLSSWSKSESWVCILVSDENMRLKIYKNARVTHLLHRCCFRCLSQIQGKSGDLLRTTVPRIISAADMFHESCILQVIPVVHIFSKKGLYGFAGGI